MNARRESRSTHIPADKRKRDYSFLRPLRLFDGLDDRALLDLTGNLQRRVLHSGDVIFHQGDSGAACYLIQEGRVRIFVLDEDGHELSVRVIGPGEIIGEMALFDDSPRSASAVAMTETRFLILQQRVLQQCIHEHPHFAISLLQTLSRRLRQSNDQAGRLASMTVEERLLRQIRAFAKTTGKPMRGSVRITMPLTQSELASLVGTSRESVNRALANLRKQGKLRVTEGWIEVTGNQED